MERPKTQHSTRKTRRANHERDVRKKKQDYRKKTHSDLAAKEGETCDIKNRQNNSPKAAGGGKNAFKCRKLGTGEKGGSTRNSTKTKQVRGNNPSKNRLKGLFEYKIILKHNEVRRVEMFHRTQEGGKFKERGGGSPEQHTSDEEGIGVEGGQGTKLGLEQKKKTETG